MGFPLSSNKDLIIEHQQRCGKKQSLAAGWSIGLDSEGKSLFHFLSTFSLVSLCFVFVAREPQRSAHLFNVEINFHPVMLNLTSYKATFFFFFLLLQEELNGGLSHFFRRFRETYSLL